MLKAEPRHACGRVFERVYVFGVTSNKALK